VEGRWRFLMAQPHRNEIASREDKLVRRIGVWPIAAVSGLIGVRWATDAYSGPSIARGLSIAAGIALGVGLLSFLFGRRFWQVIAYLLFFSG
jgi:hypothetical protein